MPQKLPANLAPGVGRYFGLPYAAFESFCIAEDVYFSATRLNWRRDTSAPRTVFLPAGPHYFVMVYMADVVHCDILQDGQESDLRRYETGSICLVDLTDGAAIRLHSDLNALAFCIPRRFFSENRFFDELALRLPLRCVRGQTDPLVMHVATALLPLLETGSAMSEAVLRPIAVAIGAHLLQSYGEGFGAISSDVGARNRQVPQAVQPETPNAVAARPPSSGTRYPEASIDFATPPDWHSGRQIAFAKQCLRELEADLATVAGLCGFSDVQVFEEFFHSHTGMRPERWRRALLN